MKISSRRRKGWVNHYCWLSARIVPLTALKIEPRAWRIIIQKFGRSPMTVMERSSFVALRNHHYRSINATLGTFRRHYFTLYVIALGLSQNHYGTGRLSCTRTFDRSHPLHLLLASSQLYHPGGELQGNQKNPSHCNDVLCPLVT